MRYFIFLFLLLGAGSAYAQLLPQGTELSDRNTDISFVLNASAFPIRGTASNIKGKLWLEDPQNEGSLKGEMRVPLRSMQSNNPLLDEKLRQIFQSQMNGEAVLSIESISNSCTPQTTKYGASCKGSMKGRIRTGGRTQAVQFPYTISAAGRGVEISGSNSFDVSLGGGSDAMFSMMTGAAPSVDVSFRVRL